MNKKTILTLLLVLTTTMFIFVGCGDKGDKKAETVSEKKETITIGYVNWAECVAVSNLWKAILEEEGYEVKLTQLDVAPLFVGLEKGDVDIFFDTWLPVTHKSYWEKYSKNLHDCGVWYDGSAKIGLAVPKYMDIDKIEDLNENYKNDIIGIDPGAGIMKASKKAVSEYGLNRKLAQGSEAAMLTEIKKAYKVKEPIVATMWTPHWAFPEYDLKFLEDSKKVYGEEEFIHTVTSSNFLENNKDLVSSLENFKLNDKQIGEIEKMINDGKKPIDAAKEWIKSNKSVVNLWLGR